MHIALTTVVEGKPHGHDHILDRRAAHICPATAS
jgi:hypothetical protein